MKIDYYNSAMDFAKSILFIIENNINDDLLNIGSNEEVSIKELASIIKKTINYEGEIIFDEEMPDGNPRKLLDSTKIFDYGWKPEIKLEQGLKAVSYTHLTLPTNSRV